MQIAFFSLLCFALKLCGRISYVEYFWILSCLNGVVVCLQQIARGKGNHLLYVKSSIINAIVLFISIFIFLFPLNLGIRGMLWGQICAACITCIILICGEPIRGFSKEKLPSLEKKEMISFSLYLIPNAICIWVVNSCDRYIISILLGLEATGILAVAHKLPVILQMFTNIFYQAFQEHAIKKIGEERNSQYFNEILEKYSTLLFTGALVMIPWTEYLVKLLFANEYVDAFQYIPILYLGVILYALAVLIGTVYVAVKKTKEVLITTIIAALLNIIIHLILINKIGLYAAVISTVIAYAALFFIRYYGVKKYITIKIQYWKMFILFSMNIIYILEVNLENIVVNCVCGLLGLLLFVHLNSKLINLVLKKVKVYIINSK